ncbi:MAG: OmpA family protein [Onishia taeanensis]|uniref:OmpA/MotB family protein n=1 Tax=Onishia taeanensis TaxID=284577 RepID=UPI003C7B32D5
MADSDDSLLPGTGHASRDSDGENWLTSYLDVLTLLITLFVLLISMSGGQAGDATSSQATSNNPSFTPLAKVGERQAGILPQQGDGVSAAFDDLAVDGVVVARHAQGTMLRIADHLLFDSASASLTPSGEATLAQLTDKLSAFPGRISVEGHSDNRPITTSRYPSNWELSSARASAVLRFLTQQGIGATRLRAIGYADTKPLSSNDDAQGRASNRRVELVLHNG